MTELLDRGGRATLMEGAASGFATLSGPLKPFAEVGMRAARLLGIAPPLASGPTHASFAELSEAIDGAAASMRTLVERTRSAHPEAGPPDAATLGSDLARVKTDGDKIGATLRQMPVTELRANREVVKDRMGQWQDGAIALHESLKATLGEHHPLTGEALNVRLEASSTVGKTQVRWAMANVGAGVYKITVGPVIGAAGKLLNLGPEASEPRAML